MLGLRFCARAFSSCGKRGPLFIAVRGPLTIVASLVVEHRLQTRRLSSCGSQAQLLWGMWDLPRPGLEPVSPALAGRFSTTAPPGKPPDLAFLLPFANTFAGECINHSPCPKTLAHVHTHANCPDVIYKSSFCTTSSFFTYWSPTEKSNMPFHRIEKDNCKINGFHCLAHACPPQDHSELWATGIWLLNKINL